MNRLTGHKIGVWFPILLAAAIAFSLFRCFSQPSEAVSETHIVRAMEGDLEISVKTVGVMDAARTHMISSAVRGDKGKIIFLVEDGSSVAKDDILIRLDPTPFETEIHRLGGEVRSLEAAVESARQMLKWEENQTQRQIRTAKYDLKVARLELRRMLEGEGPLQLAQYKNELDKVEDEYVRYKAYIADLITLQEQGFANPNELSLARKKVDTLEQQYQTARQRHESYKEHVLPTLIETARTSVDKAGIEVQQLEKGATFKVARAASALAEVEGKLETAQVALQQALAELKKTTIRAPFSGIAILYETFRDGQKRKPRVGDRVWQNQPLLYLPDISTMIVKTQVREVDLHKVAIGQACSVRVDAYPETTISGKVTAIGMLATQRFEGGVGEKYFQLTVTLTGKNSRLRPGMTARITISSDNATNVIFIPVHAVFDDGVNTFCYLVDAGGRLFKKKVALGRQNEDWVEIVTGLEEGDRVSVIRPNADQIADESP
ncbi:efflux RND transporter periplasmic adaptor subunit [Desulfosarcina variabilis]|uniref:efflux RND transporter periplasmic adaptor subunit n=1 Tax=Desulfosarcina variabilis TaxID=2300 RepID=UPI003AFA8F64